LAELSKNVLPLHVFLLTLSFISYEKDYFDPSRTALQMPRNDNSRATSIPRNRMQRIRAFGMFGIGFGCSKFRKCKVCRTDTKPWG
jgi:hypothetical protein